MPSVNYDHLLALQHAGNTSAFLAARLQYSESATLLHSHLEPMRGRTRVYPVMVLPQASGRVGIANPPIGNFTADRRYGPHGLRDVVSPDPGQAWICPDWSAVEGWIVSHRSRDPIDQEAKSRGLDLHTVTAIRMFRYPDPGHDPTKEWLTSDGGTAWRDQVGFTQDIRDAVKNARYTMQYARNVNAMRRYAVKLGMDPDQLVDFGQRYLASKPWLVTWKEQRWAEALRRKEARTAFGRRRRLLGNEYQIQKEGLNHEIQGTVADMMKMTMVAIAEAIPHARMVLQRHDGWYTALPLGAWETWQHVYTSIVEREWMIDGRPITIPAEYEVIHAA